MKLSPKNQRKPSYFKLSCYRDILLNRGLAWKSFSLRRWNAKVFARLNQKPFFAIRTRKEIRAIDFELRADRPGRLPRCACTYCTNVSRGKLPPNRVVGRSLAARAANERVLSRASYIQSSVNHIGRKGSNICSSLLPDKIWKYLFTSWCLKSKNM